MATAVGTAVVVWSVIPVNLGMVGVTSGVAGGGLVNGKVTVVPQPLPVTGAAASAGLVGFLSPSVTRAIGMGVATAFSASAQYQGASVGVGVGSDISKIAIANPATLTATLQAVMSSSGMLGLNVPRLSIALGTGISALLLTGTGVGVVTGPAGPSPGAGTSLSRVF
jgi:hypothetical protein